MKKFLILVLIIFSVFLGNILFAQNTEINDASNDEVESEEIVSGIAVQISDDIVMLKTEMKGLREEIKQANDNQEQQDWKYWLGLGLGLLILILEIIFGIKVKIPSVTTETRK